MASISRVPGRWSACWASSCHSTPPPHCCCHLRSPCVCCGTCATYGLTSFTFPRPASWCAGLSRVGVGTCIRKCIAPTVEHKPITRYTHTDAFSFDVHFSRPNALTDVRCHAVCQGPTDPPGHVLPHAHTRVHPKVHVAGGPLFTAKCFALHHDLVTECGHCNKMSCYDKNCHLC